MRPKHGVILVFLWLMGMILAGCGSPPTYTVIAKYGYSLPNVTERIQFSVYESGKEPDSSGRIISQGVSLEQARADLLAAVQQALPEGKGKGVQLIIPSDFHPKQSDLPGCMIKTTQAHPEYGLLECDGIPTGARFVVVAGFGLHDIVGTGEKVSASMLTIMPYDPVMPASMGEFFHTRQEAEEHAADLVSYAFKTNRSTGLSDPLIFYMGTPPIKIKGCSIKKYEPYKGLVQCPLQEQT